MASLRDGGPWAGRPCVTLSPHSVGIAAFSLSQDDLRAAKVVDAACHAIASLEPKTRERYRYLIQTSAHNAMQLPQPTQEPTPDETPSEWEQRGLTWAQHGARFAAQGRIEGILSTRREALFIMFDLVGFVPSPKQRAQIESCEDPLKLESWSRRIKSVSSLAELLQDD